MGMRAWLTALLISFVALGTEAAGTGPNWKKLDTGTRGTAEARVTAEGVWLKLTNTAEPKNYATVFSPFDLNVAAQKKFVFRCRGVRGNGNATLTPVLVFEHQGKWTHFAGPAVKTNNEDFKNYSFGLDSDFRLSDAVWHLRQIKFTLNSSFEPKGKTFQVEIAGVRLADADELGSSSGGSEVLVVSAQKDVASIAGDRKIKLFFEFDNDDLNDNIFSRVVKEKVKDHRQTRGFREMLLEQVKDMAEIVERPEDADVIIYARAGKGETAPAITAAVSSGKGLLVFGGVPDPEIAALLPVRIVEDRSGALVAREVIRVSRSEHPVWTGAVVSAITFGLYRQVALLNGGEALATFSGGMPAIVEGRFGKGKVIYSATGIGTGLIGSGIYYDEFLLRAAWYLGGADAGRIRQLAVRKDKVIKTRNSRLDGLVKEVMAEAGITADKRVYQVGMSADNFGRFGWLAGEGLLCDNVSRRLSVSNGNQEYRFDTLRSWTIPLPVWDLQPVSGAVVGNAALRLNAQDYRFSWSGEGVVAYTASVTLPAEWRGKKVYFEVDGGIDDLDRVRFNGEEIGGTGKDTPGYWQVPRKYAVPERLLRWGQANEVQVLIENLRGNAGLNSCPKLRVSEASGREQLAVTEIDWVHKTYRITGTDGSARRMVLSLLLPFTLYDFAGQEVVMALENVATRAAWKDARGIHVADLRGGNEKIFELRRDGNWTAPWLLLWRDQDSRPLLLVFEHQPERIQTIRAGDTVGGLVIGCSGKNIARVVAGWPWGIDLVDCSGWGRGLDAAITAKLDQTAGLALRFPVGCDEIFALDKDSVRIVDRWRYETIDDDWHTPKPAYAVLPPLAGLALQRRMLVRANGIEDFGMATKFGPLLGRRDGNTVVYELPRPSGREMVLPDVKAESELHGLIDKLFAGGVRWSCGGGVRYEAWTAAQPNGKLGNRNIDMFAWNFGLASAIQGMLTLNAANRTTLMERVRTRFVEPVECYQYKAFVRFREEPFSGLRYPLFFNSFYPNETAYASGFGSKVIYGDENEACTVVAWLGQQMADRCGQADLVRANWNFFREGMKYLRYSDDWAFNSGSCREFGIGGWIDMLNCEYAAMVFYARLAELAGDRMEADQAVYRAAKRMLPTLLRLSFTDYMRGHGLNAPGGRIATVTGFNEYDGARFLMEPLSGSNFLAAMDLFDFSQGFPGETTLLYKKYSDRAIGDYLRNQAVPALVTSDGKCRMKLGYLPPLAFWNTAPAELRNWAVAVGVGNERALMGDWPGIRAAAEIGSVIHSLHPEVTISRCRELDLLQAVYDPALRTVELTYRGGTQSELYLQTTVPAEKVVHNGNAVKVAELWSGNDLRLPVSAGVNQVTVILPPSKSAKK